MSARTHIPWACQFKNGVHRMTRNAEKCREMTHQLFVKCRHLKQDPRQRFRIIYLFTAPDPSDKTLLYILPLFVPLWKTSLSL